MTVKAVSAKRLRLHPFFKSITFAFFLLGCISFNFQYFVQRRPIAERAETIQTALPRENDCSRLHCIVDTSVSVSYLGEPCGSTLKNIIIPESLQSDWLKICATAQCKGDPKLQASFTGAWCPNRLSKYLLDESLARAIVDTMRSKNLKTLFDLGAGSGRYIKTYNDAGLDALGFDGNLGVEEYTNGKVLNRDFTSTDSMRDEFSPRDVVTCFEVGEHIPKAKEQQLLDTITRLASEVVIISWGSPGQGGIGHINNQPQDYIVKQLEDRSCVHDGILTKQLRTAATKPWFRHNIIVCKMNNYRPESENFPSRAPRDSECSHLHCQVDTSASVSYLGESCDSNLKSINIPVTLQSDWLKTCATAQCKADPKLQASFTGAWCPNRLSKYLLDDSLAGAIVDTMRSKNLKTLFDLGAGSGRYIKTYNDAGLDALGFDGNLGVEEYTNGKVLNRDFTSTDSMRDEFSPRDVVTCFEVGEHIPKAKEQQLLDTITRLASEVVIISWGSPGQGGIGHINNQPQDYIVKQLEDRSCVHDGILTKQLRTAATKPWFRHNIIVCKMKNYRPESENFPSRAPRDSECSHLHCQVDTSASVSYLGESCDSNLKSINIPVTLQSDWLKTCATAQCKADPKLQASFTGAWCPNRLSKYLLDDSLAEAIVDIMRSKSLESLFDLGAGSGRYIKTYNDAGLDALGFDGNLGVEEYTNGKVLNRDFTSTDLMCEEFAPRDVVTCFEVGEHIPKAKEQQLLDTIANLSSEVVIISWGSPGQGGIGHINNQPQDYIIKQLEDRSCVFDDTLTKQLRAAATKPWFRHNLIVCHKLPLPTIVQK